MHDGPGLSGEAESFRGEVCNWLTERMARAHTDPHAKSSDRTGLTEAFERDLQREAGRRGWLAIGLPAEVGGGGQPPSFVAAFNYEAAYHDAPLIDTAVVLAAAPVLAFGSADQRARLLPLMISGELEMCIAYTESEAGNDLAALSSTARPLPEGGFLLDGVKSLITGADKADSCLTIARTDPSVAARRGSSMFVVDMKLPGVSVRPQRTMTGYDLWEVVFDGVRLPADALLGAQDAGWRQLAFAVEQERTGMFTLGWCQRLFDEILHHASNFRDGHRPLDTPVTAAGVGRLWAELQDGRRFALRLLDEELSGRRSGSSASMAKVVLTELAQRLAQFGGEIAGPSGTISGSLFGPVDPAAAAGGRFAYEYLFRIEGPIGVGANELHRTGIAAAVGVHAPRPEPGIVPDLLDDDNPLRQRTRELLREWTLDGVDHVQATDPGYSQPIWAGVQDLLAAQIADPAAWTAFLEELGRACCPSPVVNGLFQTEAVLRVLGADSAHGPVRDATQRCSVALPGSAPLPQLVADGNGYRLSGAVRDVIFGDSAEWLLVPADVVGRGNAEPAFVMLAVRTPGVAVTTHSTLASDRLTDFTFDHVPIGETEGSAGALLEGPFGVAVAAARLAGAVGTGALLVGHGAALLSMTAARVTTRPAFGSTLAALPTVQQRVAYMYLDLIAARAAVSEAAAALAAADGLRTALEPLLRAQVAAMNLTAVSGALRIAAAAHQLCGGWGLLWDSGLHHHTRAIKSAAAHLGSRRESAVLITRFLSPASNVMPREN